MIFFRFFTYHHCVNQHTGNDNFLWADSTCFYHLLHLADNLSSKPLCRHNSRQQFQHHSLLLCGNISVLICISAADQERVNRYLPVAEIFFSVNLHHIDNIFQRFGSVVHFSAFNSRVNKCAKTNLADFSRFSESHAVEHIRHLSLGEIVSFYFII